MCTRYCAQNHHHPPSLQVCTYVFDPSHVHLGALFRTRWITGNRQVTFIIPVSPSHYPTWIAKGLRLPIHSMANYEICLWAGVCSAVLCVSMNGESRAVIYRSLKGREDDRTAQVGGRGWAVTVRRKSKQISANIKKSKGLFWETCELLIRTRFKWTNRLWKVQKPKQKFQGGKRLHKSRLSLQIGSGSFRESHYPVCLGFPLDSWSKRILQSMGLVWV